ncbi:DUF3971 domain-containing protein [Acetobacteraceae bacterium ESL0709]|nr:DUF3971 domain-containing protein [Acetobacteraceae bacterium ESL0697]MDF7677575.1 DUF3971 domain-containing protein [Acetobacteraceae bacterium ESL0709]
MTTTPLSSPERPGADLQSFVRRVFKVLAGLVGGVLLLVVLGASLLLWRLTRAPLDITGLSHYVGPVLLYKDPRDSAKNITLSWDRLALKWVPGRHGVPPSLDIHVQGIKTVSGTGKILDHLSDGEAALDLSALWHGSVRFLRGHVGEGTIGLVQKDRSFWALGGTTILGQQGAPEPGFLSFDFSSFEKLDGDHLAVTIEKQGGDPRLLTLHVPQFSMRYQAATGWEGSSELSVEQKGAGKGKETQSHADFVLSLKPGPEGQTLWSARSSALKLSDYGAWVPGAASFLSTIEFPVTLEASGTVARQGMGGSWQDFTLHLLTGSGLYHQDGADPLKVEQADFTFYGRRHREQKNGGSTVAVSVKPGSTLFLRDDAGQPAHFTFTGEMEADDLLAPKNIKIIFAFHVPKLDFAHLPSVWPIAVAKGGRRWMGANMTFGTAENFTLKVTLASQTGWEDLNDTDLEGDLWGHNLTVYWLKPLPPVQHIEAYAHFLSADALQIDLENGHMDVQGSSGVDVPKGRVLLTGLAKPDQTGDIKLALKGPLQSFLTVLVHPRLHLLSRYPVSLKNVKGNIDGELGVVLPLDANVLMSEIGFDSQARFDHVGFDNKVTGAVRDGQGSFHVTSKEISTDVKVNVRQIPLSLSYRDSFERKPLGVVNRSLKAQADVDLARLGALGLNVPPRIAKGTVIARAGYEQKEIAEKRQQGDLTLSLDLTPATFSAIIWKKSRGVPAQLMAHAQWLNGQLQVIDQLEGKGPDLDISGKSIMTQGEVTGLVVSPLHIGRTQGNLTINWPSPRAIRPDYNVFFDGPSLDLSPLLGRDTSSGKDQQKRKEEGQRLPSPKGPVLSPLSLPEGNWAVALKADRVYYRGTKFFSTFLAGAHWSQKTLQELHISLARPYPFTMALEDSSARKGRKSFFLASRNLGATLASLDVVKKLDGGNLKVKGYFETGGRQNALGLGLGAFYGRAELEDIALLHPPAFLKFAVLLTPSEWRQIGTDRLGYIKASVDLGLDERDFFFQRGQLGNAVLGGRFRGVVTIPSRAFEMQGTVSPFFSYKDPARAPFQTQEPTRLKKSFSLTTLTYKIDGTVDHPHFKVSPFSSFSPAP